MTAVAAWLVAARKVERYWRGLADAAAKDAVLEERRRIGRDLHDGLAQELAFIASQSRFLLKRGSEIPSLKLVAAAAERALYESRRAVAAFTGSENRTLEEALTREVEDIAYREGATINVDVQPGIQVERSAEEALVRIAREAVTNAVRHGDAGTITLELTGEDGIRLRVVDDGRGFDPVFETEFPGGFGLIGMGERARELGGEIRIESSPGAGTSVHVIIP